MASNNNVTYLDLGYSPTMSRSNNVGFAEKIEPSMGTGVMSGSGVDTNVTEEGQTNIDNPSQIGENVIDGNSINDLYIKNFIKSRNYKPKAAGFLIRGADGYIEAMDVYLTGTITATAGEIGGWDIVSGYIYSLASGTPTATPNDGIVMASGNEAITIYENTEKRVEVGYLEAGVYGIKGYDDDGTTVMFELSDSQKLISGVPITNIASGTEISIQGWTSTLIFTVSDYRTVTWSAGDDEVIKLLDGTTYTITNGTTGAMSALTYIYFDVDSPTELQFTTTATTAVGSGKILIAVAEDNSDTSSKASLQVFGGKGGNNIFVDNIAANSASTNEFISNTAQIKNAIITDAKIDTLAVSKLTAGTITSKVITLAITPTGGDTAIKAGKTDFTNSESGFILGLDDSDSDLPKFYIGTASYYMNFDGSNFIVRSDKSNLKLYDAVVDVGGYGDYSDIQSAIDAGKTNIFVRNGTYTLSADIVLPNGCLLTGESLEETIIDLNNTTNQITANESPTIRSASGTLTVTNNSTSITTTGNFGASANDFILIHGIWYKIASASGASATLSEKYFGQTESGINDFVVVDNIFSGLNISNFKIINSGLTNNSLGALHIKYSQNSIIEKIIFAGGGGAGLYTNNTQSILVNNCISRHKDGNSAVGFHLTGNYEQLNNSLSYGCGLYGVQLNGFHSKLNNIQSIQNQTDGFQIGGSYNSLSNCAGLNNNGKGAQINNSDYNKLVNCDFNDNGGDGIELNSGADYNSIVGCNANGNGVYGIDINHSDADKNRILGNDLLNNTTGALNDSGTATQTDNNITA